MSIKRFLMFLLLSLSWLPMSSHTVQDAAMEFINAKIAEYADQSGAHVLNTGSDALSIR